MLCHEFEDRLTDYLDGALDPQANKEVAEHAMRETAIACSDFEEHLTDYLDGFLLAPLYHRWERHAALCVSCSELPGDVVRVIGACYTYKQDELTAPAGLEARILQSTIGNVLPQQVRAPLKSRWIEWLRATLDPI